MPDYAKLKNAELEALLKSRSLPHTGKKAEMVARLQDDDAKKDSAPATDATPAEAAPAAAALPPANEDEIDWDDEAADPKAAAPANAEAATDSKSDGNNPAAVPNQVPAIDPATTDDLTVIPPATDAPAAEPTPEPKVDYAAGLASTSIDEELERRKKRAARFGVKEGEEDPIAAEAIKKLERAKKFNETGGPRGLDEALPEGGRKRRGDGEDGRVNKRRDVNGSGRDGRRDGNARDGRRQGGQGGQNGRRGGQGRRDERPRREGGERLPRREREGGERLPGWMTEKDRQAAQARKNRFEART
ncbi:hypothetical protein EJ06DRAFT_531196 [Trichodelitschia bisporula]|uniref:SAP domain-containing protein n=1 Tax=Trichodelitschia bisporula TaxID=703511 RepID=A0A6G1HUD9_9PEZI|nr:hypothetical protein EJ06DRAFT_531196 [Trichodelitschia bisporula]